MNSDRIKTASYLSLGIAIILSMFIMLVIPEISKRYQKVYDDLGTTLPMIKQFYLSSKPTWAALILVLFCITKQFYIKDHLWNTGINTAIILILLFMLIAWVFAMFGPIGYCDGLQGSGK